MNSRNGTDFQPSAMRAGTSSIAGHSDPASVPILGLNHTNLRARDLDEPDFVHRPAAFSGRARPHESSLSRAVPLPSACPRGCHESGHRAGLARARFGAAPLHNLPISSSYGQITLIGKIALQVRTRAPASGRPRRYERLSSMSMLGPIDLIPTRRKAGISITELDSCKD